MRLEIQIVPAPLSSTTSNTAISSRFSSVLNLPSLPISRWKRPARIPLSFLCSKSRHRRPHRLSQWIQSRRTRKLWRRVEVLWQSRSSKLLEHLSSGRARPPSPMSRPPRAKTMRQSTSNQVMHAPLLTTCCCLPRLHRRPSLRARLHQTHRPSQLHPTPPCCRRFRHSLLAPGRLACSAKCAIATRPSARLRPCHRSAIRDSPCSNAPIASDADCCVLLPEIRQFARNNHMPPALRTETPSSASHFWHQIRPGTRRRHRLSPIVSCSKASTRFHRGCAACSSRAPLLRVAALPPVVSWSWQVRAHNAR